MRKALAKLIDVAGWLGYHIFFGGALCGFFLLAFTIITGIALPFWLLHCVNTATAIGFTLIVAELLYWYVYMDKLFVRLRTNLMRGIRKLASRIRGAFRSAASG